MVTPTELSFSEALSQYVAAKKNGKKTMDGHQEIGRFIAWIGRERTVRELTPSEVADYAQYVGLGGAEAALRLTPVKTFLAFLKDQGWVDSGLAAHLRVPRSRKTAGTRKTGQATATSGRNGALLSREGYERLVVQLEELKGERVGVVEDIKRAMEDKDFRENAPLDAAKERQGLIESRIRVLENSLSTAEILTKGGKGTKPGKVVVGTKVTLKDVSSGKQVLYTLVDVREADVSSGKISTASPVGQALLDRTVGEEVSINVPKGTVSYRIQKIAV